MYTLLIRHSAERDLRRLPRVPFVRVNERIQSLREYPRPHGVRKLVGAQERWRVQVDDYRILYQIYDDTQTVTIVRVKHRRNAYR